MTANPNEVRSNREVEPALKANDSVFTVGPDYSLQRGAYIGLAKDGSAVVNAQAVTGDQAAWLDQLSMRRNRNAIIPPEPGTNGNRVENYFAWKGEPVDQAKVISIDDLKRLNPSRDVLVSSLEKLSAQMRVFSESGMDVPVDIATVGRGANDLAEGKMTPDAYKATEQHLERTIGKIMKQEGLPLESPKAGHQLALDCLRTIDVALKEASAQIRQELLKLNREVNSVTGSTFADNMKRVQLHGAMDALQDPQKLLGSLHQTRTDMLTAVGRLAVASDWYHETNPAQPE